MKHWALCWVPSMYTETEIDYRIKIYGEEKIIH